MNGGAVITLPAPDDLDGIFAALRDVLSRRLDPDAVRWVDGQARQNMLFDAEGAAALEAAIDAAGPRGDERSLVGRSCTSAQRATTPPLQLPRAFIALLRAALLHDNADRHRIAHTLAAAILRDRRAWDDTLSAERLQLERMAREVRREIHKMHAFVRFRPIEDEAGPCHVAWFEPEHHVVRTAASFFVDRFAAMRWAILTPRGSVHWDRRALHFGPPASRSEAPRADEGEALWLAYYRSVFNPARLKPAMMRREMPVRFWRNLPEAVQITQLMQQAGERTHDMANHIDLERRRRAGQGMRTGCHQAATADAQTAPEASTPEARLHWLARQASVCNACEFAADTTQMVWGEGSASAALMLVGEQPGDQEDLVGRPFVGPAGQLLRRAIAELGWPAEQLYFTNAVKHFKYLWRGKRRIHKTAAQREAEHCAQWLEQEIRAVQPRAIVALGRTALSSLLQAPVGVEAHAGQWLRRESDGLAVYVIPHPAAVLRAAGSDLARREAEWTRLLAGAAAALEAEVPQPA